MKKILILPLLFTAGFILTACNPKDEEASTSQQQPENTALREKLSSDASAFQESAKHLDMGGVFYGYINMEGDIIALASAIDEFLTTFKDEEELLFPTDIATKVVQLFGLDSITTIGASSVKENDGVFLNKYFIDLNGQKKGIFRLYGEAPFTYKSLDHVPASTIYLLETKVNTLALEELIRETWSYANQESYDAGYEKIRNQSLNPMLENALTVGDLFDQKEIHVQLLIAEAGTFLPAPFSMMRSFDFSLRLSGLGSQIERIFAPETLNMSAVEVDTLKGYQVKNTLPASKNLQPAVVHDTANGDLVLASSLGFIQKVANTEGIQSTDVQTTLADLKTEGNLLVYQSKKVNQFAQMFTQMGMAMAPKDENLPAEFNTFILKLVPLFYPTSSSVGSNAIITEKGVHILSRSPKSPKTLASSASVLPVGMLSAMAIPAFQKVRTTSQHKIIENNLRMIAAGALQYQLEHGVSEATYQQITESGILQEIKSVAGEDYSDLVIKSEGQKSISVTTSKGEVIEVLLH